MPSVSVVELTNTFDDWRNRTNDVITEINGANSVDPTSAIVYANSSSGFQVNEVVSDAITGTAITGTRLIFTGGNINFTSANTQSLGNVHQTHVLGGTAIDVNTPENADTSISNTFIFNSKINLNGQKFVAGGASQIDLAGATITNLGTVSALTANPGSSDGAVAITNPTLVFNSGSVGGITISAGTHTFEGATISKGTFNEVTVTNSTVHSGHLIANGTGYLATTNSVSLAIDNIVTTGTPYVANVAIGKFTEVSSAIDTNKIPKARGRIHMRTEFAAASDYAAWDGASGTIDTFAANTKADELLLEGNTDVGMTLLSNATSNAHILFGNPTETNIGGITYNHATDSMHFDTDGANTVVIGNEYNGHMQVVGNDTVASQTAKFQVTVGPTDGGSSADTIHGIFLDADDADQKAMLIDGEQTISNIFEIQADALTSGSAIFVDDNSPGTESREVLHIKVTNNDGYGAKALQIDTTNCASQVINHAANNKIALNITGSGGAGAGNYMDKKLVSFVQDANTSAETLYVQGKWNNDGTPPIILTVANTGSDMFSVSSNGNIGINDTTPTYKLDVNGTLRSTGVVNITNATESTGADSGALQVDGGVGINKKLFVTGATSIAGITTITNATESSGNDAGALQVDGGVGINKKLNVGGAVDFDSTLVVGSSVTATSGTQTFGNDVRIGQYLYHSGDSGTNTYMRMDEDVIEFVTGGDTQLYFNESTTYLYYNGNIKFETTTGGATVTGNLSVSGGSVCANGVECAIRIEDSDGTLLNSC